MALVQCKLMKITAMFTRMSARSFSNKITNIQENDVKKSVFISQSNDIYTNLALEDWLYRNFDFTNHHVLMLWRNNPCVVIGRHQNPWIEANVAGLNNVTENGVQLARRNSGGGTVYHDMGNLNMTFFTPRERYNRKYNLELITRALFREYGMKVTISPREDLTIRGNKLSGTAAKLGRVNSYHHCTLLVDVNKTDLHEALHKVELGIKTNATKSINSKIINLTEENPKITVDNLLKAVGWEFMRTSAFNLKDGGEELANKQKGFQMINPTNKWFPGIDEIHNELENWDWCYGKTPKFNISRSFPIPAKFLNTTDSIEEELKITMVVDKGIIADVHLYVPPGVSASGLSGNINVITNLKGHKFTLDALNSLEWSIGGIDSSHNDEKDRFVTDCVRQVMTSV